MKRIAWTGWPVCGVLVAVCLFVPGQSAAVDGVVEINQTRALAGGVTSGDSPGFPVTIDQPGSYRLTGDLTVSDPDDDGIRIERNSVTIDLNGFAVRGPGQGVGSGDGISAISGNVSLRNGTVEEFPGDGIGIAFGGFIDGVRALTNGDNGIRVSGLGSRVTNCVASSNLDNGILTGDHAVVTGNTVSVNGGSGIQTGDSAVVRDNTASNNAVHGIFTDSRSVVRGNTANGNTLDGIHVSTGVAVNNESSNNGGDGFEFNGAGAAMGNSAQFNTGYGLRMTNVTAYSGNSLFSNTAGNRFSGVQTGGNLCGSTLCP